MNAHTVKSKKFLPIGLFLFIAIFVFFAATSGSLTDGFGDDPQATVIVSVMLIGGLISFLWVIAFNWCNTFSLGDESATYLTFFFKKKTFPHSAIKDIHLEEKRFRFIFKITTCMITYDQNGQDVLMGISSVSFPRSEVVKAADFLASKQRL